MKSSYTTSSIVLILFLSLDLLLLFFYSTFNEIFSLKDRYKRDLNRDIAIKTTSLNKRLRAIFEINK